MSTQIQDTEKTQVNALVIAAQAGDRDAFGELFERFHSHVLAIAMRRLGDYAEAQELCQEVFIQAMQKLDQLRVPEAFGGWLRSIAHRMAINRVTRRRADIPTEPVTLEATCVENSTPFTEAIESEEHARVREGLERLRDLDRETLVAFYIDGQSLIEMSDEFDAPLGTIKRRLHVARKRLAKEVESLVAV
jgi:RNA polymerase sigma-70 factor (ECF subfamily)